MRPAVCEGMQWSLHPRNAPSFQHLSLHLCTEVLSFCQSRALVPCVTPSPPWTCCVAFGLFLVVQGQASAGCWAILSWRGAAPQPSRPPALPCLLLLHCILCFLETLGS